jgi:hypothetical protein
MAKADDKPTPKSLLDLPEAAEPPPLTPEQSLKVLRRSFGPLGQLADLFEGLRLQPLTFPNFQSALLDATPVPKLAGAPTNAVPLSVNKWLFDEIERRKLAGDIPTGRGSPTLFSKQLEIQMAEDVRTGKCSRALKASSIRVRLYDQGLYDQGQWLPKK